MHDRPLPIPILNMARACSSDRICAAVAASTMSRMACIVSADDCPLARACSASTVATSEDRPALIAMICSGVMLRKAAISFVFLFPSAMIFAISWSFWAFAIFTATSASAFCIWMSSCCSRARWSACCF